jgi:uncharacterized protein YlaI
MDNQILARFLNSRPIQVDLRQDLEERIEMAIERDNLGAFADDPVNPNDDEDIASYLMGLVETALGIIEADAGITVKPSGEVQSIEVTNEEIRRRNA